MSHTREETTPFHKIGVMMQFSFTVMLTYAERSIYHYIIRMSLGYNQTSTRDLPIARIIAEAGGSDKTIKKAIDSLMEKNLITKLPVNYAMNVGRVPNRYRVVFKPGYSLGDFPKSGQEIEDMGNGFGD